MVRHDSESQDRVGIIRRSLRCLAFGIAGVIPFIGFVPALLAMRLYRQVAGETGEHWSHALMYWFWGISLVFLVLYFPLFGWAGASPVIGIGWGAQIFIVRVGC
jgi:uncharacterized BrkB/YihY/UPF0761 family membrane protein